MPEKDTLERVRQDKREGKSPTTQAGEFVREEIHHIREGKHGGARASRPSPLACRKHGGPASICRRRRRAKRPTGLGRAPSELMTEVMGKRRSVHRRPSGPTRFIMHWNEKEHRRPRTQHFRSKPIRPHANAQLASVGGGTKGGRDQGACRAARGGDESRADQGQSGNSRRCLTKLRHSGGCRRAILIRQLKSSAKAANGLTGMADVGKQAECEPFTKKH